MELKRKSIYGGEDPVDLPAYSIQEAARLLRVSPSTVRAWTLGQPIESHGKKKLFRPVVDIADRDGRYLSFRNLVELHVLVAIRRQYGVSLQNVRRAVDFMQSACAVHIRSRAIAC